MDDPSDIDDLVGDVPEPPGVLQGMTYDERVEEFLRLLGEGYKVREASASCAIAFSALYRRRKTDPAFAKAWENARRVEVKHLVAEAERRAMRNSDKMLMFLLTNYAPDKFKSRSAMEITNPDGSLAATDQERAAKAMALFATAKARKSAADVQSIEDLL